MTYEDVLKQIQDAGLMGQFSSYDLDTARRDPSFGAAMLSYKKDWNSTTDEAARSAINQKAEALRKQYGSYYGGSDGSRYYALGQTPSSYQSPYQSRIDEALAGLGQGSAYQNQITSALQGLNQPTAYQDRIRETLDKMGQASPWQDQISLTLDRMNNYGDFSYGPAPAYTNRYQQQLDELLGKVQNYGPFSWSKEEDPSYAAYAKQYRREGDRAAANALAQAASATGGQVSTAAMTAASQAGDYYAGQLADKIPELYENAYQRYLSEYSRLADQLGQTQRAEQYDYAKYQDQLGQYNTDRALSYDQWLQKYNMLSGNLSAMQSQAGAEDDRLARMLSAMQSQDNAEWNRRLDALGAYQNADSTDWERRLDALGALQGADDTGYSRYLDQVNYAAQQDALEREQTSQRQDLYQKQLDAILAAGGSPSAGMVAGSGYDNEYVQAMENYYKQQALAAAAKTGGGGSRSGSSGSSSASSDSMDYGGLFAAARESGNPRSFISNRYKSFGFSSSSGLWDDYQRWAESQEDGEEDPGGTASGGGGGLDMRSVTELGYGPITAAELDRLVKSGEVEEYQEGGKLRFRRTGKTAPQFAPAATLWGAR